MGLFFQRRWQAWRTQQSYIRKYILANTDQARWLRKADSLLGKGAQVFKITPQVLICLNLMPIIRGCLWQPSSVQKEEKSGLFKTLCLHCTCPSGASRNLRRRSNNRKHCPCISVSLGTSGKQWGGALADVGPAGNSSDLPFGPDGLSATNCRHPLETELYPRCILGMLHDSDGRGKSLARAFCSPMP